MIKPQPVQQGGTTQQHNVAVFLNNGSISVQDWVYARKSTSNDISMNPNTTSKKFVDSMTPEEVLQYYAPTLNQPYEMVKGDPAYEKVKQIYFDRETGAGAKTEVLIIFYEHDLSPTSFKAWMSPTTIIFDSMNPSDSSLTFNISLNNITSGVATITNGVVSFTADELEYNSLTVTVVDGTATEVEGATVKVDSTEVVTDALGEAVFTVKNGSVLAVGSIKGAETGGAIVSINGDTAATITIE